MSKRGGSFEPVHRILYSQAKMLQATPAERRSHALARHLEKQGQDIRHDFIQEVRQEIEAGTYEDDEKLTQATNRLLDHLSE